MVQTAKTNPVKEEPVVELPVIEYVDITTLTKGTQFKVEKGNVVYTFDRIEENRAFATMPDGEQARISVPHNVEVV